MQNEVIDIAGLEVQIVRRKRMRSIRLRVAGDASVVVSASLREPKRNIIEFVEKHLDWIKARKESAMHSRTYQAEHASEEEKREWRQLVEAATRVLLETWEPIIGVRVKKLAFRNMKSRWGSCQPATGRVCINTRLALYPPRCLEYVLVHELVHMLEPSHNARFHALMTKYLPDWKESRDLLKG